MPSANMQRVHGSIGFRRLRDAVIEDRRKRYSTGEFGYIPMSSPNFATELVTWPFPEVTEVFKNLQATEAPNHDHRNENQDEAAGTGHHHRGIDATANTVERASLSA